jgi:glycosyltransferase involved in cell wall biosynthesis
MKGETVLNINLKRKKILIFHPSIAPYRIRFFNELYKRLETIICLYYQNLKSQTFDYEEIKNKFEFVPDYFKRSIKIGKRTIYLGHRKRILDYNPDIVIVGEFGEDLWSAILTRFFYRRKYKIITICDDSLEIAKTYKGIRKILRNIAVKYLDGIILCNEKAEAWYHTNFQLKTTTFPIIQEEREFREREAEIRKCALNNIKEHNLVGKRVFLFVGRFAPEKNIRYLIQSFLCSHKTYPDNVLLLIGGVSEKDSNIFNRIQKQISEAGAEDFVIYLGRKEGMELKAWYFVGQVLVLPSLYERFGAVVNEALLAGEYAMVSEKAGASCLINDQNGEIIDISKPYIDFSQMTSKIKPIDEHWKPGKSKMPFEFDDKMKALVKWLQDI